MRRVLFALCLIAAAVGPAARPALAGATPGASLNTSAGNAVLPTAPNNLLANPIGANISTSGTLATTNITASTSPTTGALTVAGGLGVGGSLFANHISSTLFADPVANGAKCDGTTDDSATFASLLATGSSIVLPYKSTCVVKNLSLGAANAIDLNQGTLQLAAGGTNVLTLSGSYNLVENGSLTDPNNYSKYATTTSTAAAPGATTLTVASAVGMAVGSPIEYVLACGNHGVTKITSITANVIGLADAVPSCASAASIVTGGSGYAANDYINSSGGTGVPISLKVLTVTAGAVATFDIAGTKSGQFSSTPANPVAFGGLDHSSGSGLTMNITWSGVANGAAVTTASPLVLVDGAYNTYLQKLNLNGPLGLLLRDSSATNNNVSHTYQGRFAHLNFNNSFGSIFINDYVNNTTFEDITAFNGTFGLYVDTRNWATSGFPPSGGHKFTDAYFLQSEIGILLDGATLDTFQNVDADSGKLNANGAGPGNGWIVGNTPVSLDFINVLSLGNLNGILFVGSCSTVPVGASFAAYTLSQNLVSPACTPTMTVPGSLNLRLGGTSTSVTTGTDGAYAYLDWFSTTNSYLGVNNDAIMNLQANGTTIGSWNKSSFSLTVPLTTNMQVAGGSPPTASGTCTVGTQVGGNIAGSFVASAACAGGTVVLTFATPAPHDWRCTASDATTPADTLNQTNTAASTTGCTFTATMALGDLVRFNAVAF